MNYCPTLRPRKSLAKLPSSARICRLPSTSMLAPSLSPMPLTAPQAAAKCARSSATCGDWRMAVTPASPNFFFAPTTRSLLRRRHHNHNVIFLAADCDEDETLVPPYLQETKPRTVVVFADGLDRLLAVNSFPTVVVLDRTGKIAYRAEGYAEDSFTQALTAAIRQTLEHAEAAHLPRSKINATLPAPPSMETSPPPRAPPKSYSRECAPYLPPAAHIPPPALWPPEFPSASLPRTRDGPAPSVLFSSATTLPAGPRKKGPRLPRKIKAPAETPPARSAPRGSARPDIRHRPRDPSCACQSSKAACAPGSCSLDGWKLCTPKHPCEKSPPCRCHGARRCRPPSLF